MHALASPSLTRTRVVGHHFKSLAERTEIITAPGQCDWVKQTKVDIP